MDQLDRKIAERHAQELADLERRQSSAGASDGGPAADVMQLANTLYDTRVSAAVQKVSKALLDLPEHPETTLATPCINSVR